MLSNTLRSCSFTHASQIIVLYFASWIKALPLPCGTCILNCNYVAFLWNCTKRLSHTSLLLLVLLCMVGKPTFKVQTATNAIRWKQFSSILSALFSDATCSLQDVWCNSWSFTKQQGEPFFFFFFSQNIFFLKLILEYVRQMDTLQEAHSGCIFHK